MSKTIKPRVTKFGRYDDQEAPWVLIHFGSKRSKFGIQSYISYI